MPSDAVTGRICRHLLQLWESDAQLTLEYVESWTAARGHKVSRQTVHRALHGKTSRMRQRVAEQLAHFIEEESEGRIAAATLLRGRVGACLDTSPQEMERTVAKMLVKGDLALDEASWREGLDYFEGALQLMKAQPEGSNGQSRSAYDRIGNCYLWAAREPEIARGYYEAALREATTVAQRVPLLCRVADTHGGTDLRFTGVDLAAGGLADAPCADARAAVLLRQAEMALDHRYDLDQARALAHASLEASQDVPEQRRRARRVLLAVSGARREFGPLQHQSRCLQGRSPFSWTQARGHMSLADAYAEAGQMPRAMEQLRGAEAILQRLSRTSELSLVHATMGRHQLKMGEPDGARRFFQRSLEVPSSARGTTWWTICKTWSHACGDDGYAWVEQMLSGYAEDLCRQAPQAFGGRPSKFPRRLGQAERICRDLGRLPLFRQQLTAVVEQLSEAGYDTDLVWFFAAQTEETPATRPATPPRADLRTWTWTPGSDAGALSREAGSVCLSTDHPRGTHRMDMPRLVRRQEGDFVLEATIHAGRDVEMASTDARQRAAAGEQASLVVGSGGLLVDAGGGNLLRLIAHMHASSEVIFQAVEEGQDRTAGRGLLADGRLRLRLERRGELFLGHAADEDGPWHSCGVARMPAWRQMEVGLFAEAAVDPYCIVERAEARFADVRLTAP
jgi:tetratricopeptide (TPR) repeat protein